jgi:hypothetical protein
MRKLKKPLRITTSKSSQREVFPLEIEHLLDVLARIEARRQLKLRAEERKSVNATPEIPS